MNYFKAAEQDIASIPMLKKSLENLKLRQKRLTECGRPSDGSAIDYTKPYVDSHAVNDIITQLVELSEVTRNIAETAEKINEIEGVVNQLIDEYKAILKLWYIDKLCKDDIMRELHVNSPKDIYSRRNRAIAEFAILYYGAAALPSI